MKVEVSKLKQSSDNPRTIDQAKFLAIKESIRKFPEMMEIRPIVVNKNFEVLGGNMRLKAVKELNWKEVEVEVLDDESKEYEFVIKDNLGYGDWNWTGLVEDFKGVELTNWGLDIPVWYAQMELDTETKPKTSVKKQEEARISTKKALYFFYTNEEKLEVVKMLNILKENWQLPYEQIIVELVKKQIDEYENLKS